MLGGAGMILVLIQVPYDLYVGSCPHNPLSLPHVSKEGMSPRFR